MANSLDNAQQALHALAQKHGWKVWASCPASSGWMDGEKDLHAIVELRRGRIIKIKSGAYADPSNDSGWMVESESGGWFNLSLIPELRNAGKVIYRIVGLGEIKEFESEEELKLDFDITGRHESEVTRRELQNQPILAGLVGPMYDGAQDGIPVIRYETSEAYAIFSN